MKRLLFRKNDLTEIPVPEAGYIIMGLDSDDKLKYVDDQGSVSTIGGLDIRVFNGTSSVSLTQRELFRFTDFLEAVDDELTGETIIRMKNDSFRQFSASNLVDIDGNFRLSLTEDKILMGSSDGLAIEKTLTEAFTNATQSVSSEMFHIVNGQLELLIPEGETIVGDSLQRGRPSMITDIISDSSIQTGLNFKVGLDGKLTIDLQEGYIIRGDQNGEGSAQKLIQGNNKIIVTNDSGIEEEVDVVKFFDLLSVSGVNSNGVLNTVDLSGTASGVLGGWEITDFVIENTTSNIVVINIGTTNGGNDVLSNFSVDANFFNIVSLLKTIFSKTVEQSLHISSSNWNGSNLVIKISVKKIF